MRNEKASALIDKSVIGEQSPRRFSLKKEKNKGVTGMMIKGKKAVMSIAIMALLIMACSNLVVLGAGHKIGYNYFGNAGVLVTLGNHSKYVIEAFGGTALAVDNNFTVDKIVTDLENLISAGVDGLIV